MFNADCSKPGICVGSKSGSSLMEAGWGRGVSTIGVVLIADWGDGILNVGSAFSMLGLVSVAVGYSAVAVGYTAVAVVCGSFCLHANRNRHTTKI